MERRDVNLRRLRAAPLHLSPFRRIKALTLERTLPKLRTMEKTFLASDLPRAMKNMTVPKSLTCARSVGGTSPILVLYTDMKRLTVQKSPMCVNCVGKASLDWSTFPNTR